MTSQALDDFLASTEWAQGVAGINKTVHGIIKQELGLQTRPTHHAPSGVLDVSSLDGATSHFRLHTYKGDHISHMYQTTMVMPKFGMVLTKTGVHANMLEGTPFLDIEICGNANTCLLTMVLAPRLCTLRHPEYLRKYWRTAPASATGDGNSNGHGNGTHAPILPFTELYARMAGRAGPGSNLAVVSTPTGGAGPAPTTPAVYTHFHSKALFTRVIQGHGALFEFAPSGPGLEAAVKDATAMAHLWCAWVRSDATAPPLTGDRLHECKDMTRLMANNLDFDDETPSAEKLVGPENTRKLKETVSGLAALEAPWWIK